MKNLISVINEIVKYGLEPHLAQTDKEASLERNLVEIYYLYLNVVYEFDDKDYPDWNRENLPNIRQNIESNFPDFGLYKTIVNFKDLENKIENSIGDAVDDLTDIILDLLEVRWRIENNSWADGLWYFKLIFYTHTQQHILDLLNYMKQKNG